MLGFDDTGEWEKVLRVRDLAVLGDLSGSGWFWPEVENFQSVWLTLSGVSSKLNIFNLLSS